MMKQQILIQEINEILSNWDPIGVEKPIAEDEYRGYIPEIMQAMDSKENLKKCLIHILDRLGMSYDVNDNSFEKDILFISEKILALKI